MSFWERLAESERELEATREAASATAAREHAEAWLDVAPALCALCSSVKRTVLLGVCGECLDSHD